MTSELVVDVQPKEVSIALLEDKSLVELQSEGRNISFSVGNMYLGRVKKLMPGLNACFVDVGYEKDAFLHYLDLGPQFNSLEKFVKQTLSDKKKLNSISKATLLPDLGQRRHSSQYAKGRTRSSGADCKGTDLNKRTETYFRTFICRKIFSTDPFQ
ncbi:hypothetical protein NXV73_18645 [Bacteroides salyersiae]|nr:hypothetical protein [Bacteroides salyersiae]